MFSAQIHIAGANVQIHQDTHRFREYSPFDEPTLAVVDSSFNLDDWIAPPRPFKSAATDGGLTQDDASVSITGRGHNVMPEGWDYSMGMTSNDSEQLDFSFFEERMSF